MYKIEKLNIVRFAPAKQAGFFEDLKKNVENYFSKAGVARSGNRALWIKAGIMLALYLGPLAIIITNAAGSLPLVHMLLWTLMGIGVVGIGCAVMHDANHGSFSENKKLNKFTGSIITLLGGYHVAWRIQHNILHHTYTNIEGLDEDINAGALLRFSPHTKHRKFHRFQHLYAWFLYGLMTMMWCTTKDFSAVIRYHKSDMLKKERITLKQAVIHLILLKIGYFTVFLVLPLIFSSMAWGWVVGGFLLMHFVASLSLSCIFQLAHVMGHAEFPMAVTDKKMENSWAIHQMKTTVNFAPHSRSISWFIGGLNFQVEHHLFPHISHVHYPELSAIVRETAQRHDVPYLEQPTFFSALREHARMLKQMGKK